MAVSKILSGQLVNLVPVTAEDAQFTMDIRNDEALTEFIPRIETTLEKQQNWINSQREKEGDYFYIITQTDGTKLGTAAVYDVEPENDICEFGRYISYGNAYENVETALLALEYIFYELKIPCVMLNNDVRNKKIISFWKRFGATFDAEYDYGTWTAARYLLTCSAYEEKKDKIKGLIEQGKRSI